MVDGRLVPGEASTPPCAGLSKCLGGGVSVSQVVVWDEFSMDGAFGCGFCEGWW